MYATGNKKMLNMLILEILREYTDEEHSLTQQEILKLLDDHRDGNAKNMKKIWSIYTFLVWYEEFFIKRG